MKPWLSLVVLTFWLAGCDRLPSSSTPSSSTAPENQVTNATVVAPTQTMAAASRPPAPAESNAEQYQQALALENDGKLAEARAVLQPLGDSGDASDKVLDLLGAIDAKILFTAASAPEKTDYTIVSGDTLGKLAQKFGTTIDLIKKSNNLSSDVIRIGDRLRIYQGHFAVTVSKATNELRLTDNGKFFKRYHVGTGQYSKTPVGDFKITTRPGEGCKVCLSFPLKNSGFRRFIFTPVYHDRYAPIQVREAGTGLASKPKVGASTT